MPKRANLSVNTPEGRKYIEHELDMLLLYEEATGVEFIQPPTKLPAQIDGFGVDEEGIILFGFEAKCRNESLASMNRFGTWLISHNKIENGTAICKALCVPFVGLLYTIEDTRVVQFDISDTYGNVVIPMETKRSRTQATVNGGSAVRENSYIPMSEGRVIV